MTKSVTKPPNEVLTIGHSTRSVEAFIELLQAHDVKRLVDVRTVPRSRHNPQFNKEVLPATLRVAQIKYTHVPGLGGLRHARRDSPNTGWRNASFRGFADYMQTEEFESALEELMEMAAGEQIGLMCAEAVPWRCHRSLIADALLVRGAKVRHIMNRKTCPEHSLTPWAMVKGKQITYPAETLEMNFDDQRKTHAAE
jgi:uncharacterized protein (DUF488 family)